MIFKHSLSFYWYCPNFRETELLYEPANVFFYQQLLRRFILSCLQECENQNMTTIAFPAVGTGSLGYPKEVVAEEMCNVVINFSTENYNTCLEKVLFVIYEEDIQTIQVNILLQWCQECFPRVVLNKNVERWNIKKTILKWS